MYQVNLSKSSPRSSVHQYPIQPKDVPKDTAPVESSKFQTMCDGPGVQFYLNGLNDWKASRYQEALDWFYRAADENNADAMYYIGKAYEDGLGVESDEDMADEWFAKARPLYKMAADDGSAYAIYQVAKIDNRNDELFEEALAWFILAAEKGYVPAMYMVGLLHDLGEMVARDLGLAKAWYSKAAEQGDAKSMHALGDMAAEKGDDSVSEEWYVKAANHGHADSMHLLAVKKRNALDYSKSFEWEQKAANLNHPEANYHVGMAHYYGVGVQLKDPEQAMLWFHKADKLGFAPAKWFLSKTLQNRYWNAQGQQDKSRTQLAIDAHLGDPIAMNQLGMLLQKEKDYEKAVKCYRDAANKGDANAMSNLGHMYEYGLGVEKNFRLTWRLYEKAAELKNVYATYRLGLIELQNNPPSFERLETATSLGHPEAQLAIGAHYLSYGDSNLQVAVPYCKKAAEEFKNVDAMFSLGSVQALTDIQSSCVTHQKAIDLGHAESMVALANSYFANQGVQNNAVEIKALRAKGHNLYQRAADLDYRGGWFGLAWCHFTGQAVGKVDPKQGRRCAQRAAELGNSEGFFMFVGCVDNPVEARHLKMEVASLHLSQPLDKKSAMCVGELLAGNTTIQSLTLSTDKTFLPFSESKLIDGFRANHTLRELRIELCGEVDQEQYPFELLAALSSIFEENSQSGLQTITSNQVLVNNVMYDFLEARQRDMQCRQTELMLCAADLPNDVLFEALFPAMKHNDNEQALQLGMSFFEKRKYPEALKYFHKSAQKNNPAANYHIGIAHKYGLGVPKDPKQALTWFQKAAKLDFPPAKCAVSVELKNLYWNALGLQEKSRDQLEKEAQTGSAAAMNQLGMLEQTQQNDKKAFECYQAAANGGDPNGMSNMGYAYQYGIGCGVNPQLARQWYDKAAQLGNVFAVVRLGGLEFGAKNYAAALENFDKADALNTQQPAPALGMAHSYLHGLGRINKDFNAALNWYKKAFELGEVAAAQQIAFIYEVGLKDIDSALIWKKKAAALGDPKAMTDIGNIYITKKDFKEAHGWFLRASDMNDMGGLAALGWLMMNTFMGKTKEGNLQALEYIQRSTEGGNAKGFNYYVQYVNNVVEARNLKMAVSVFDLSTIKINTKGAQCLGQILAADQKIESLVVNVSETDMPHLVEGLKENKTLKKFYLTCSEVSEKMMGYLQSMIENSHFSLEIMTKNEEINAVLQKWKQQQISAMQARMNALLF